MTVFLEIVAGIALRCAKVDESYPANSEKPEIKHFSAREEEVARARDLGRRIGLSGFLSPPTSPQAARDLMPDGEATYLTFAFSISRAREIAVPGMTRSPQFFLDPEGCAHPERPGAEGHIAMEGLVYNLPGEESKKVSKLIRTKLIGLCWKV